MREGAAIKRGEGSHNAQPAVILGIQKQPAVNTLELTERIDATLDDIQRALPQGMQIHRDLFRQADFIEQSLDNLFTAFVEGAALVILVVVVFLMNVRAAVITLLALPLSLVAAVIAMDRFGLTINSMSLGGLAIAIGELVDDAIIDVENVVRRLRENAARPEGERAAGARGGLPREHRDPALGRLRDRHRRAGVPAAVHAEQRRRPAAAAARLRLRRRAGRVAGRRADGDAGAVLVAAAAVAPDRVGRRAAADAAAEGGLRALARRTPSPTGGLVLGTAAALLVAAVVGILAPGRSFLPEFNEGALTVSAVTIPGTSLADSNALGNALERLLLSVPEVTSTARRTGRAELDEHVQGVESAEIDVRLAMKDRPREAVLEELRQKVSLLPGTNVTIGQPISHRIDHMLSGTRANIAVKIFGDDLPTLRQLGQQVQAEMAQVAGVVDLADRGADRHPDADGAGRSGRGGAARAANGHGRRGAADRPRRPRGRPDARRADRLSAGRALRRGRRRRDLDAIGSDARSRRRIAARSRCRRSPRFSEDRGPNFVMRENVQRRIVVQSNVAGRDLRGVVNDIQARVGAERPAAAGYHVEYGGQFESEAQASQPAAAGCRSASIVAIFFILSAAFGSSRDGLLIMLNLPLALIGGVVGVYLAGGVLSVASIVGFITLFGIATRNGIMLVSHIRHLQEHEGVTDFRDRGRSAARPSGWCRS